jgi:cell division protein FtsL
MTTDDINRVIVFVLLLLVAAFMTAVGVELIAHNPLR